VRRFGEEPEHEEKRLCPYDFNATEAALEAIVS
jgi:hypothetical protein